ncbi:MAG: hypothetical protein NPIRA02_11530 [Nitrospirales bacterium]|nr:MAG: hypothetical protein NPIRA02_11530 [Nitrospirales bacterium]
MKIFKTSHSRKEKRRLLRHTLIIWLGLALLFSQAQAYEVWVTDQSDTMEQGGGYIHVYDGSQLTSDLMNAKPTHSIDTGTDINSMCKEATGKTVRRPHMVFFTKDHNYAVISFLSGQVLFMDAEAKTPIGCISVGKNVHAAWPTPDQNMVMAANIKEKKFVRIWTDYASKTFMFDGQQDVVNLQALQNGERPDNAPICPITESTSTYAFVTLRGGGLLVVNVKDTPMKAVAALSDVHIHPGGCGGIQVGNTMYINSGGGWPVAPLAYDVYAVKMKGLPGSLEAKLVSTRDSRFADSHGMTAIGQYLWVVDRAGNIIEIIDTLPDLSIGMIDLVGSHSQDPAPDLIGISPDHNYAFTNLRGIHPLTANNKSVNNAKGSTPGLMVIKVKNGGRNGEVVGIVRISNMKNDKETADPHGLAVRG